MSRAIVRVQQVVVRYGPTTALASVSLDILPGEVHAIIGENGAGKSTLLHVLAGVRQADEGSVDLAPGARVAWVPQEPDLPIDLTVAETIFLGAEPCGWGGWLRRKEMASDARALLAALDAHIEPDTLIASLSAAQRKQVQIAHALRHHPDVLLLDEPTAVLGAHEAERLFDILGRRRAAGQATIYVSHRLQEVMRIADRVTVLRDGRHVSTDPTSHVVATDLINRMVGRVVSATRRSTASAGADVLRVSGLSAGSAHDITFSVRAGEIVGLAGLVGAGRSDVVEAVAGFLPLRGGSIACGDTLVLLPEDRGRNGIVPALNLRENLFVPASDAWVDRRRERRDARAWIDRLGIRTQSSEQSILSLSGGNQQKLLLARALRRNPRMLLLDEPTAGIDVAAKAEIHAEIAKLADTGVAILLASSELPELLHLCDRILAMYAGRIVGEVLAREATEERLAALITGSELASGVGSQVSG